MIITIGSILPDNKGNKYEVIKNIKPGGFGQVFLCKRIQDDKRFAVKTMLNAFPSNEEYNAFQNEVNAARTVKGENVIKYEFFHDGSAYNEYPPYIIMEYANQGSLKDILDERRKSNQLFTNEEITEMLLQLARGMACINEVLVHRDIKPANILIKDSTLKITDFGLAKYTEASTRYVTFKGYGTKAYCSPEVWENDKNTIQMDIYSMGIVFYEIATLEYPYRVNGDQYEEAHLYTAAESPMKYNPNLEPRIVSIINKMLQKPRSKRFKNWKEIIDILESGENLKLYDNTLVSLVQAAVKSQNATDNAIDKKKAEEAKKRKEWENHVKKIMAYFENEIIRGLEDYIDLYNSQYAAGKIVLDSSRFDILSEENKIIVKMPRFQTVTITISIVNPENYIQNIGYYTVNGTRIPTARKFSYPSCDGKKVLAWGKFEDNQERGYNILLLDNKIDEYGDWYILYNVNSALNSRPRREPFAFSKSELPREVGLIKSTHIYSSILEKYNLKRFQQLTLNQITPI